jgi:GT2 family glycosyltransferase
LRAGYQTAESRGSSVDRDFPRISIIILNWNNWRDTLDCLESLHALSYPNHQVIIVDNGSTDGSLEKINTYCADASSAHVALGRDRDDYVSIPPLEQNGAKTRLKQIHEGRFGIRKLTIIRNEENYGYAEGNNVGIRCALKDGPDAVVLLNNDTVVHPEFLTELVKASETRESAGFFGPKIYYYDSNGRKDVISSAGGKFRKLTGTGRTIGKHEVDIGQYDAINEVDYLEGSCLLVKTHVIDKIGLLDPIFFAYWEDVDWCVRGKHQGYASIYVPNAKVWHKASASNVESANIYFMARNRFWFMKKHSSPLGYRLFLLYFFLWPFWRTSASKVFYRRSSLSLRRFWLAVFHGLRPDKARPPY